jgi:hypothetical protein
VAHRWERMGGSSWLDDLLYDSRSGIDLDHDPLKAANSGSQLGESSPPSLQRWDSRTMP